MIDPTRPNHSVTRPPPGRARRALLLAPLAWPLAAQGHGPAGHRPAGPAEQQAWGIAGEPRAVRRTVDVTMHDTMRFTPDRLRVAFDETLRLRVRNAGRVMHELVIGDRAALDEHAELMVRFPNMAHDEPWMAHVEPGATGTLVWRFNRRGTFHFACLIAGHYSAGMIGRIDVV